MRKGFIFNQNLCVSCNACSAGCLLENGWTMHPRTIYTYNSGLLPSLPVINLSIACNHCEKPVCLEGCPASAYTIEQITGSVIIDDDRCIGCKYCQWNCPYDAPKLIPETKTIGKCDLCYTALIEDRLPACTLACPTGALNFGELSEPGNDNFPSWFPGKNLNPAIEFRGIQNTVPLRVIPEIFMEPENSISADKKETINGELSLVAFTFLTTISVAANISSLIAGKFPNRIFSVSLIIFAGLISLLHLGRALSAWRSVINFKSSPLSREIAIFILYSCITFSAVLFQKSDLLIASSVTGLILLVIIDSVYIYSDKRKSFIGHSGQTFLSALLIVSFFTGYVLPFIFIAVIKLFSSLSSLYINKTNDKYFEIRYLRLVLLLVTGVSMLIRVSNTDPVIISLFLTGELIDRILFYIDFNPANIKTEIIRHINLFRNEKKSN